MGRNAKNWSHTEGVRPYRVRVYERKPGGILWGSVWDPTLRDGRGGERRASLGHTDRDQGIAWAQGESAKLRAADSEAMERGISPAAPKAATLAAYVRHHLDRKREDGETVERWAVQVERHLQAAVAYFGAHTPLAEVTTLRMNGYVAHLRRKDNGRGGKLSDTSVRKYLNSLSNLFARAVAEERAEANPVARMYSKPTESATEAEYLEPEEAALLLEAARTYDAGQVMRQGHGGAISAHGNPWIYPILATFLLTGGRKSEVLGLEVDDVSFKLGKVYFRPNAHRRLKTRGSKRSVPLWPQLREILEAYMMERERTGGLGSLLFPSVGGRPHSSEGETEAQERMIRDLRKALDAIGSRAGFPEGHVRLHMLRHTYTAARIQTLDRGAPVALYSVARELGHRSTTMIEDRYGHLHDRAVLGGAEEVSFRVEDYRERLGDRLAFPSPAGGGR